MKKIGMLLLAIALVAGLAGCPNDDPDYNPVGTWTLYVAWGACTSASPPTDVTVWHIYGDGTFKETLTVGGSWSTSGDDITLTYYFGTTYTGTKIDQDTMQGTVVDMEADTGCWTAKRTSEAP